MMLTNQEIQSLREDFEMARTICDGLTPNDNEAYLDLLVEATIINLDQITDRIIDQMRNQVKDVLTNLYNDDARAQMTANYTTPEVDNETLPSWD